MTILLGITATILLGYSVVATLRVAGLRERLATKDSLELRKAQVDLAAWKDHAAKLCEQKRELQDRVDVDLEGLIDETRQQRDRLRTILGDVAERIQDLRDEDIL
jgi:predicted LPLAT superfamily acyltransferase